MSYQGLEAREQKGRENLPLELVLVRHAEPDYDWARQTGGDPGLTELGRRQAGEVAAHLTDLPLAALYCSPLARARATAVAVGDAQGIEPEIVEGLAEIRIGDLRAVTQADVDKYFAAAARRPFRDYWEGFPGGEPFRDFHRRVTAAIESVLARYGARPRPTDGFSAWEAPARGLTLRIGVVGHGGTNGVILTHLLGIPPVPWEWIRFETPLAAYSVVALRAISEQGYIWSLQTFGRRVGIPQRSLSGDSR